MKFRPSVQEIYDAHSDDLASYTRRLAADSAAITKADYMSGLALEGRLYAPLGEFLEEYDALVCPTMAIPAFTAEYDLGEPVLTGGRSPATWLEVMVTLPFNITSRCLVRAFALAGRAGAAAGAVSGDG